MKHPLRLQHAILSVPAIFFACVFMGCATTKYPVPVTGASAGDIKQAITSDRWIFLANYAMPQSGRSRALNANYTVYCNKDSLVSVLPYFGRAHTAIIGETSSPLDFTSTDFQLTKNEEKEDKWRITVKPTNHRDVQSYDFTIFTNGSAQLNVLLTNRSAISFSGTIAPVK